MDRLIDMFKILSDETRLRLIALLAQEDLCVCEMSGILELSQPKVSKHLAKLRDKNFVSDIRKEQFIFYSLRIDDPIIRNLIADIIENLENYPQLKKDSERLFIKEEYLNQSNVSVLKNFD